MLRFVRPLRARVVWRSTVVPLCVTAPLSVLFSASGPGGAAVAVAVRLVLQFLATQPCTDLVVQSVLFAFKKTL